MNRTVVKSGTPLDNQFVVPYNRDLLLKFQCHINLEVCNNSRSLKYLFKYCLKGHDNATMLLQRKKNSSDPQDSVKQLKCRDEVKQYLDGRYICASEACWRLLGFDIHYRYPTVERLPVHEKDGKCISFKANESLNVVADQADCKKSKLEAWFLANQTIKMARDFTYQDFPRGFTWNPRANRWQIRKRGIVVGRLSEVHASSGDTFFLRMLLLRVKGATSFTDLRTVDGRIYDTFKEACAALGLLRDDKQWHAALLENSETAMPQQLRAMFVHMLTNCPIAAPHKLWDDHWKSMSDDVLYKRRKAASDNSLSLSDEEIKFFSLAGKIFIFLLSLFVS